MFEKTFHAGWGDMDFNSHMRNTAYLDKSVDARFMFFAENGLPLSEFLQMKIGPVVVKDEINYYREFHLLDEMRVTLSLAGMSNDGSRIKVCNEFFKGEQLAARVTSHLGWIDLTQRKFTIPPARLIHILRMMPKAADFEILPDKHKTVSAQRT